MQYRPPNVHIAACGVNRPSCVYPRNSILNAWRGAHVAELNKLSDLRGSFHHLLIQIHDPEWRQEETPIKLIKVEPEEVSPTAVPTVTVRTISLLGETQRFM